MEVTVYTTPTCSFCHQIKAYLGQRSVPFREVDVSRDANGANEMVQLSGQRGVPVTRIDGQIIVGFDRPRIDAALAQAQRPRLGAAVASAAKMRAKGQCSAEQGAFVGSVRHGGAADMAGLKSGDVIVSLGGRAVASDVQLQQLIAGAQPGQRLSLRYQRGEALQETFVTF